MSNIYPGTALMAVYYVVPVEFNNNTPPQTTNATTQVCLYYSYNADDSTYSLVDSSQLKAVPSGSPLGLDYIALLQLSPPAGATMKPPLKQGQRTPGVTLFSVTAKNLLPVSGGSGYNPLPNVFLAAMAKTGSDALASVVIPVAPPEVRGVILIFSVQDSKGNTTLRSSSDPEIKGSTNG